MRRKRQRLTLIGLILLGVGAATALTLTAFEDNLLFFYSPSDLEQRTLAPGQRIRLGGLVAEHSVSRLDDGVTVRFTVTDMVTDIPVDYTGILPDLFRECQGVVAEGRLRPDGTFAADQVLAKHDENYMPPEVAEALPGEVMCGDPIRSADQSVDRDGGGGGLGAAETGRQTP